MTDAEYELMYDPDLRAPGCVLIQAACGCDSKALMRHFDPRHWLVAPTPGMRRLRGTDATWKAAAGITEKRWGDEDPNGAHND